MGKTNTRTFTHARLLFKAFSDWTEGETCEFFDISCKAVIHVRQRYLKGEI